tara:strand:- start:91 stop:600 length:510 start_codon:yes stop_codon:yes gene_type:complete
MNDNLDRKIDPRSKVSSLLKENKKKILFFFFITIFSAFTLMLLNINSEKKNKLLSEKYIQASVHIATNENEKALSLLEEIIKAKNKFYSVLALNTLLEKKLDNDSKKILDYFNIVQNINLEREQKDLIIFKKALYLKKILDEDGGNELLNNLINSNSKLKNLAEVVLAK